MDRPSCSTGRRPRSVRPDLRSGTGERYLQRSGRLRLMADVLPGDDRAAVSWALSRQTPAGKRVAERVSRAEQRAVTDELLLAIREEWQGAGRTLPSPHVPRDAVTLADGTTVIGARFLVEDPYNPDEAPLSDRGTTGVRVADGSVGLAHTSRPTRAVHADLPIGAVRPGPIGQHVRVGPGLLE